MNSMQVKAGWGMVPATPSLFPALMQCPNEVVLDVDVFSEQPDSPSQRIE